MLSNIAYIVGCGATGRNKFLCPPPPPSSPPRRPGQCVHSARVYTVQRRAPVDLLTNPQLFGLALAPEIVNIGKEC